MEVMLMMGDKVLDTLTINPNPEDAERAAMADYVAPIIKFFDRSNAPKLYHDFDADGRRHRLSPIEIAHHSTGVDRRTGQRTLGVGVESRSNGTVRFEADLWKLSSDLSPGAIEMLQSYWQAQNARTPAKVLKHHFGPTHFQFDALPEQVKGWRVFLVEVLSGVDGYSPIH